MGRSRTEPTRWQDDGTVQGVKYLTYKPNHDMFIRPSQVKIVSEPTVRCFIPQIAGNSVHDVGLRLVTCLSGDEANSQAQESTKYHSHLVSKIY